MPRIKRSIAYKKVTITLPLTLLKKSRELVNSTLKYESLSQLIGLLLEEKLKQKSQKEEMANVEK